MYVVLCKASILKIHLYLYFTGVRDLDESIFLPASNSVPETPAAARIINLAQELRECLGQD
jgi:hypothetical protein